MAVYCVEFDGNIGSDFGIVFNRQVVFIERQVMFIESFCVHFGYIFLPRGEKVEKRGGTCSNLYPISVAFSIQFGALLLYLPHLQ